ncbi:MAG: transporter substrate-binding domain-containing protein [archaeon]|nr:transporter substrate-binding domain-containing protein [archaeon]
MVVLGLIISNSAYSLDKLKVSAPPSIWTIVGNTTLEGPVIDLTTSIFSELGIEIQTVPLPWIRALKKLEDGSLDMILTIFHTEERAKIMDFTSSYVIVPTVIVVAKGKGFPFAKPNDLIGLSGLKQRGASLGKEFEKITHKLKLYEVNTETQIVRMLNIGRADYAVGSKYVILISAKRIGFQDKIEILPKPVTSRDLRMAFSKKSKFLKYLPQVNKKILQRKKSGMIADMVKKAIDTASKK